MELKVYDKIKWHYPEGQDCPNLETVIKIFTVLMEWLKKNEFLTEIGKEELELGLDSSYALTSEMLTKEGNLFLEKYYKKWIHSINYDSEVSIKILGYLSESPPKTSTSF